MKKYKKSPDYTYVIFFSILCGEIFDEDFNLLPTLVKPYGTQACLLMPYEGAIIINPETKLQNIAKLFKDFKRQSQKLDLHTIKRIENGTA